MRLWAGGAELSARLPTADRRRAGAAIAARVAAAGPAGGQQLPAAGRRNSAASHRIAERHAAAESGGNPADADTTEGQALASGSTGAAGPEAGYTSKPRGNARRGETESA